MQSTSPSPPQQTSEEEPTQTEKSGSSAAAAEDDKHVSEERANSPEPPDKQQGAEAQGGDAEGEVIQISWWRWLPNPLCFGLLWVFYLSGQGLGVSLEYSDV